MKKLLLSFAVTILFSAASIGQCVPGANYADSTFGAWPDTIENFPLATTGLAYVTDLNFKVPVNSEDVDPTIPGGTIDDFTVTSVTGLPTGYSYTCNDPGCYYVGGSNGCAQLAGTCSTPGTYEIEINVNANVTFFFGTIPYDYTFTGYRIQVSDAGYTTLLAPEFEIFPNPGTEKITLNGLADLSVESLQIVDMSGNIVSTYTNVNSSLYTMNISHLETGVYFVKINHDDVSNIVKFIKE